MLAFEFFAERWVRQDDGVRLASPVHPEAHSYAALNTRVARQWRPIFSQYRLQLASLGFIRSARFQEASILAARILVVDHSIRGFGDKTTQLIRGRAKESLDMFAIHGELTTPGFGVCYISPFNSTTSCFHKMAL